jgi:hypothetical protein
MKRIFTLRAIATRRPAVKVRLLPLEEEVAKEEKVNCVCP